MRVGTRIIGFLVGAIWTGLGVHSLITKIPVLTAPGSSILTLLLYVFFAVFGFYLVVLSITTPLIQRKKKPAAPLIDLDKLAERQQPITLSFPSRLRLVGVGLLLLFGFILNTLYLRDAGTSWQGIVGVISLTAGLWLIYFGVFIAPPPEEEKQKGLPREPFQLQVPHLPIRYLIADPIFRLSAIIVGIALAFLGAAFVFAYFTIGAPQGIEWNLILGGIGLLAGILLLWLGLQRPTAKRKMKNDE